MQKYLVERLEGLENEDLKSLDIQKEDIPEIKSAFDEVLKANQEDKTSLISKIIAEIEKGKNN